MARTRLIAALGVACLALIVMWDDLAGAVGRPAALRAGEELAPARAPAADSGGASNPLDGQEEEEEEEEVVEDASGGEAAGEEQPTTEEPDSYDSPEEASAAAVQAAAEAAVPPPPSPSPPEPPSPTGSGTPAGTPPSSGSGTPAPPSPSGTPAPPSPSGTPAAPSPSGTPAAPSPSGSPSGAAPGAPASASPVPTLSPMTPAERNGRFISHTGPGSCGTVARMTGTTSCGAGAPYFHPTNCVARIFSAEQAGACLNGSDIFIVGNSVARQMMYELGVTLNGGYSRDKDYRWGAVFDAARDRVQQKMACAKAPSQRQDSHAQSCEVAYAPITRVHYMWRQWMGEPFAYADTAAEGDFCFEQDYVECMGAFLAQAKPGDLLIFQLGLAYARYLKEDRTDIAAYMATEARSFVSLVHRVWRGGVVLGVDTTPMQPTASGTGWPPGTNTRAATINAAIVPIFQEAGWPVVNQHSINTNGTTNPADVTAVLAQQYEDPAHFPTFITEDTHEETCLSKAFWQHALSLVCPLHLGTWPAGYTPPAAAGAR